MLNLISSALSLTSSLTKFTAPVAYQILPGMFDVAVNYIAPQPENTWVDNNFNYINTEERSESIFDYIANQGFGSNSAANYGYYEYGYYDYGFDDEMPGLSENDNSGQGIGTQTLGSLGALGVASCAIKAIYPYAESMYEGGRVCYNIVANNSETMKYVAAIAVGAYIAYKVAPTVYNVAKCGYDVADYSYKTVGWTINGVSNLFYESNNEKTAEIEQVAINTIDESDAKNITINNNIFVIGTSEDELSGLIKELTGSNFVHIDSY